MSVRDEMAQSTGVEQSADLKRRNVLTSQPNGNAMPIQVDEKTKEKVRNTMSTACSGLKAARSSVADDAPRQSPS